MRDLKMEKAKVEKQLYRSYEEITRLKNLESENRDLKKEKLEILEELRKASKENKQLNDKLIRLMEVKSNKQASSRFRFGRNSECGRSFNGSFVSRRSNTSMSFIKDTTSNASFQSIDSDRSIDEEEVKKLREIIESKDRELSHKSN